MTSEELNALPKAELHCHLEGALHLPTLWEIAQKYDPTRHTSFEELRTASTIPPGTSPGFKSFLARFEPLRFYYGTAEAIRELVFASITNMSAACYREIRFSPVFFARRLLKDGEFVVGPPPDSLVESATEAVLAGIDAGMKASGCSSYGVILTCSRHFGLEVNAPALALLHSPLGKHFIGIDLAGFESLDSTDFVKPFLKWKDAGKLLTIHAGEDPNAGGPRAIIDALDVSQADRIGHGVRAVEDPELVARLARTRVPLELCPTSNLQTLAVPANAVHPMKALFDAGLNISISTDDPTICGTTLDEEYALSARLGMSGRDLRECTFNAIRASVLTSREKKRLTDPLGFH